MLLEYDFTAVMTDLLSVGYRFSWVLLLWVVFLVCDTLTWRHSSLEVKNTVPFFHLLCIKAAGQTVNQIAPSGNLGEVVKGKYLAEYVSGSESVASVVIFNFLNLLGSIIIILFGAVFSVTIAQIPVYLSWLIIVLAFVLSLWVVSVFFALKWGLASKVVRLLKRFKLIKRPENLLESASRVDRSIRNFIKGNPRDFWIAVFCQVISRGCSIVEVYLICLMLNKPIGFEMAVFIQSTSQLMFWLFSMIPFQLGFMEQGSDMVFSAMNYQPGVGFTFELVRRARRLVQVSFGLVLLVFLSIASARKTKKTNAQPALSVAKTNGDPTR
jgi:uncharacterized protein (TIRG00374 family)